jgi:hypothetical protein
MPDASSSISTTTETSSDSEVVPDESEEEKTDSSAMIETDVAGESIKSKRTIERNLGYGFNQPNSQNKFRTYPYQQQLRHYSPHQEQQQAVEGHRPYSTAPSSGVGSHYPTQEPVYFARPSYQQVPAAPGHSSGNGAHVFPPSGPPPHAPIFLTAQHGPLTAVTPHSALNPFLAAGNFHGDSLLYQHPGTGALTFLHNPSSHIGPQILPVIILRVNSDAGGNSVFHHQGGISPAFLHGLNLQTLLYPTQHYQAPQPSSYARFEGTPQLLYQERDIPKPQKVSYEHQKKPFTPTVAPEPPHQQQKLRKNIVLGDRDKV